MLTYRHGIVWEAETLNLMGMITSHRWFQTPIVFLVYGLFLLAYFIYAIKGSFSIDGIFITVIFSLGFIITNYIVAPAFRPAPGHGFDPSFDARFIRHLTTTLPMSRWILQLKKRSRLCNRCRTLQLTIPLPLSSALQLDCEVCQLLAGYAATGSQLHFTIYEARSAFSICGMLGKLDNCFTIYSR
jgi:hypothetical protein